MLSRSSDSTDISVPDPLSDVLRDLRPSGISYGHCRLAKPWGVYFPEDSSARLRFVVNGECWFRTAEEEPARLRAGDVVLLPNGDSHALADTPRGRTKPLSAFPHEEIGDRTYRLTTGGSASRWVWNSGVQPPRLWRDRGFDERANALTRSAYCVCFSTGACLRREFLLKSVSSRLEVPP